MFKVGDRVRFKSGVTAAYNPNRTGKVGAVTGVFSDGGLNRADVQFDGEDAVVPGLHVALLELAAP